MKSVTKKQAEKICQKLDKELVSFRFLAKGNHNDNYLVETTKNKYVLRIENNPQFKNLKKEYNFLKRLKPGLGPKVYFFDSSCKILAYDYFVEEFIEGKNPKKLNDQFIILMAAWLKKLHQHKKINKKFLLLSAIKPYQKNVLAYKKAVPTKVYDEIEELFKKAICFCKENNILFANRKNFSLLHGDLSKENIIYDGKSIRLIDWEFSRYGFPEWDLVYFMQSLKLNPKQKKVFLKKYGFSASKQAEESLLVVSLLNTCGDIGYSVWRLGLLEKGKLNKKLKPDILKRLNLDISRLTKIIKELKI